MTDNEIILFKISVLEEELKICTKTLATCLLSRKDGTKVNQALEQVFNQYKKEFDKIIQESA